MPTFTIMPSVIPDGKTIRKQLSDAAIADTSITDTDYPGTDSSTVHLDWRLPKCEIKAAIH